MTDDKARELLSSVKLNVRWIPLDGWKFCQISDGPNYLTTLSKDELRAILQLAPKDTE